MRNVRPSWVSVDIDGWANYLEGGPRSRDGALRATFQVRSNGEAVPAVYVDLLASADKSTVTLVVFLPGGREIHRQEFTQ